MVKYKIKKLEQGTIEWKVWRSYRKCASEAAVIMNCAPSYWSVRKWEALRIVKKMGEPSSRYSTSTSDIEDALRPMMEPRMDAFDYAAKAMRLGHEGEAKARPMIEDMFGFHYPSACIDGKNSMKGYAASLDGLSGKDFKERGPMAPLWVEVKTPVYGHNSKMVRHLRENEGSPYWRNRVPSYIWWQLVHQCMVVQPNAEDSAALVIYVEERGHGEIIIRNIPCEALLADVPALMEKWMQWDEGADLGWNIPQFAQIAQEWLRCKKLADEANYDLAEARARLEELLKPGDNVCGSGVEAKWSDRKGMIDYKKFAKDMWEWVHVLSKNRHNDLERQAMSFDEEAERHRRDGMLALTLREDKD